MIILQGALRSYPWGSRTALATLTGRQAPTDHPEAEIWYGAHIDDPSRVVDANGHATLREVIAADPITTLGAEVAAAYDGTLPVLLKLLAADEPLSLQAHPSKRLAEEGYDREERLGIVRTSPQRNYKDRNHKPELIFALTEFEAMAGFRPVDQTAEILTAFAVPVLAPCIDLLTHYTPYSELRTLVTTWVTLPTSALVPLIEATTAAAQRLQGTAGEVGRVADTVIELADRYPGDPGVLIALLLNRLTLQPGEALYLGAGNLHAYIRGLGVEIMANSDNVLRGGLTGKHVDVAELLRVLHFSPLASVSAEAAVEAPAPGITVSRYSPDVAEFVLDVVAIDDTAAGDFTPDATGVGPRILLGTAGAVDVSDAAGQRVTLTPATAVWVNAGEEITVHPRGEQAQLMVAGVAAG